jgi:hypothetical protein
VRIYAQEDYLDRLTKAGFCPEVFRWTEASDNFGGVENKFGLLKVERLYLAKKD